MRFGGMARAGRQRQGGKCGGQGMREWKGTKGSEDAV